MSIESIKEYRRAEKGSVDGKNYNQHLYAHAHPFLNRRPEVLPKVIEEGPLIHFTPGAAAFIRSKWAAACELPHRRLHLGDRVAFSFATLLLCMRNCNLVPDVTFLSLS